MANVIKIKKSSTATKVPAAGDLEQGELAINTTDEKLFTKNTAGTVVQLNADTWRDLGTTSTTACAGNDSRLSDARTPTSHTHNYLGLTAKAADSDKLDGLDSTKFTRETALNSASVGAGWITVAKSEGGRHRGEVIVSDSDSGDHAYIRIEWIRSYADSNFTVITCGGHGNRITGARVLHETADNTYGWKLLQVYVTVSSNYRVQVFEPAAVTGWSGHTVIAPIVQDTITGYAVHGNELTGLDSYSLASEEGILAGGNIKANGTVTGSNLSGTNTGDNAGVTSVATSGAITGGTITGTGTIGHSTAAGNKHIPTGGTVGQVLKNTASGTAAWAADTNTWRSISDSTSETSSTISASQTAVKAAYDKGNHSHPYLGSAETAADSEKVDGINGASLLRSDVDDTFSGSLVSDVRNKGIFGTYDSYKTDHIWSMGTSYKNHESGTNFGNLYGLAYKHTNNTTGGTMAGGHQMVWCQSGDGTSAMGTNLWTSGAVIVDSTTVIETDAKIDADKIKNVPATWTANTVYTHPTTAGNKHIPSGGTVGQVLKNTASGTAAWAADNNTTYSADGNYGMTLSGTAFRLENDRRRNSTAEDVWSGNTHDYTWYDANVGIRWYTAGAEDMRLTDAGDLHVDGDITAYSTTVSDERLKHDIKPIENALDKVGQLNGCTFTYNADGKESAGLIAQDVEKVLPSAVTEKELPLKIDDGNEYKVLQYDQTIGLLVEAIKELTAKVNELEAR